MALWYLKRVVFGSAEPYLPLAAGSPKWPRSSNELAGNHKSFEDTMSTSSCASEQEKPQARFVDSRTISDATIGLSDGLTVPFALTAGLSALGDPRVVVYGGLAELIAGAISMGLGGYLGARCESDAHDSLVRSTSAVVRNYPSQTTSIITDAFADYALPPSVLEPLTAHITSLPHSLQTDFVMRFHHQSPSEQSDRVLLSAVTIALGYFLGGAVPLLPYILVGSKGTVQTAFWWSCFVMVIALFTFGAVKSLLLLEKPKQWEAEHSPLPLESNDASCSTKKCVRGGVEMVVLGGFAALAAMGLVKLVA